MFQAAISGGLRPIPRILVDGYLVDESFDGQVVLIMNNASTVQADRYYCFCSPASSAATTVNVLGKLELQKQEFEPSLNMHE